MPFWHVHIHHWGDVHDRQQRCVVCGIVRVVECAHKWEVKDHYEKTNMFSNARQAFIEVMVCACCGERKHHEVR